MSSNITIRRKSSHATRRHNFAPNISASEGEFGWLCIDDKVVGCIALRELHPADHSGEIKRMYVQPAYRKLGIAQALLSALESFAARAGYKWLYLDSAAGMDTAIRFYQKNDYDPCPRYNDNPQAIIFLCKGLAQAAEL
ncbi:MAG: GNAT family N-acetyltransferase [Acidobacteria bacterium]|nr:GNAT family N-acetyltransferase [Acidobacteriota bacterium]MBS1864427.1 GNAT family N-acetyltransferase [Acidobacteriota bacterium]